MQFKIPLGNRPLLHVGCSLCSGEEEPWTSKEVLRMFDYKTKTVDFCCGKPELDRGDLKAFEDRKEKNLGYLKGVREVAVSCPDCLTVFREHYKLEDCRFRHVIEIINERMKLQSKGKNRYVLYHDACHLSRYNNIIEEPRSILKRFGYTVKELPECREQSNCCGDHAFFDNLKAKIASNSAGGADDVVVSACPTCVKNFRAVGVKAVPYIKIVWQSAKNEIPKN